MIVIVVAIFLFLLTVVFCVIGGLLFGEYGHAPLAGGIAVLFAIICLTLGVLLLVL